VINLPRVVILCKWNGQEANQRPLDRKPNALTITVSGHTMRAYSKQTGLTKVQKKIPVQMQIQQ